MYGTQDNYVVLIYMQLNLCVIIIITDDMYAGRQKEVQQMRFEEIF